MQQRCSCRQSEYRSVKSRAYECHLQCYHFRRRDGNSHDLRKYRVLPVSQRLYHTSRQLTPYNLTAGGPIWFGSMVVIPQARRPTPPVIEPVLRLALIQHSIQYIVRLFKLILEHDITLSNMVSSTYDHRVWKTGLPVRSAVLKPHAGRLVVGWVTTSESLLLYVFILLSCL
ncbi:hypothetical protein ASPBRDRAFT_652258 [Aspergillus brasiliensis CBS 101740]|uniref:Uncharacterized protein n=1 Tax=Aspergillus brasiliensis (strain CBS 101740 / IMI 381727 / IBT 21946) TaxID=767769 RepID=A0A1L9UEW3_ASPBC|nr:hypothetical protein ASPBRDRAFT_652258 [Aspergillus brasiliensis CBS 101740]